MANGRTEWPEAALFCARQAQRGRRAAAAACFRGLVGDLDRLPLKNYLFDLAFIFALTPAPFG
jgi:hypothetical protein